MGRRGPCFVLSVAWMNPSHPSSEARGAPWLAAFHAGERATLEGCYREHVGAVLAAATRVLPTVDAETVTHDVFLRLLTDDGMRATFKGGNLGGWLSVVAQRAAIDLFRRRRKEVDLEEAGARLDEASIATPARDAEGAEASQLVERFVSSVLPEKYRTLFELRFIQQLSQRDAAAKLAMQRSTLAYQEQVIRRMLEDFLLGDEP